MLNNHIKIFIYINYRFILFYGWILIFLMQNSCYGMKNIGATVSEENNSQNTTYPQQVIMEEENNSQNTTYPQQVIMEEKTNIPLSSLTKGYSSSKLEQLEETALVDSDGSLSGLYLLAFQEDFEKETNKSIACKYALSAFAGIGPIIPQIAIALKIGEYYNSPVLGYCIIGTTILAIEGITTWMIGELIDEGQRLIKTLRRTPASSLICNKEFTKGISTGILSVVLGMLSSAPDVYKTYKYNSIKEFAIISFIYDSIPRTIGFYKIFTSFKSLSKNCFEEKSVAKEKALQVLELSKRYLINKCKVNSADRTALELENYNLSNHVYTYLSSNASGNAHQEALSIYYAGGFSGKALLQSASLVFPLAGAGFNLVLAYRGYSLFIENQVLSGFLAGFSVLPTSVLNAYVIRQASGHLFDRIYSWKLKSLSSDYFGTFYPKMNIVFRTISSLLGIATSVGGFYIIADNLGDTFLDPLKYLISALAVTNDLAFGSYTIYSTLVKFGEIVTGRLNKGASYILNCIKKLDDLRLTFSNASHEAIENFLNEISF